MAAMVPGCQAPASGALLVIKGTCNVLRRKRMKDEDKKEGSASRMKFEMFPNEENITHFKHPHELRQVENEDEFNCGSCGEVGKGKRYTCSLNCGFHLHLVCSLRPIVLSFQLPDPKASSLPVLPRMIDTTAHPEHQVKEVYKNADFKCVRCKTEGNGIRYHCDNCDVDLHQVCASNPTRIMCFMHSQHELVLRTKRVFKACSLCGHRGDPNTRMYMCDACDFNVHPTCSQWPQYLIHQLHPIHPLQLKYMSSLKKPCDAECVNKCKNWRYTCDSCNVHIHLECILSKSVINDSSSGNILCQVLQCACQLAVGSCPSS